MKRINIAVLAALASVLMSTGAYSQTKGDPVNGAKLAAEWCAKCHDIGADGVFKQYPPSFASIAVYRSEDYIFSRVAFSPVHTGMPQMSYVLKHEEIGDLVAYIVSLEK